MNYSERRLTKEALLDFVLTTKSAKREVEHELGINYAKLRRLMKKHFGETSINNIRAKNGVNLLSKVRSVDMNDFTDDEILDFCLYAKSMVKDCESYLGISYGRFKRFATQKYGTASKVKLEKLLTKI